MVEILLISIIAMLFIKKQEILAIILSIFLVIGLGLKSELANPLLSKVIENKGVPFKELTYGNVGKSNYRLNKLYEYSLKINSLKKTNSLFSKMIENPKDFVDLYQDDFYLDDYGQNGSSDRVVTKNTKNYENIVWCFLIDSNLSTNAQTIGDERYRFDLKHVNDIKESNNYKWMVDLQNIINDVINFTPNEIIENTYYPTDSKFGPKGYNVNDIFKIIKKNINLLKQVNYGSYDEKEIDEIMEILSLANYIFWEEFSSNMRIVEVNDYGKLFEQVEIPENGFYGVNINNKIYANQTNISYGNSVLYSIVLESIAISRMAPNLYELDSYNSYNVFSESTSDKYIKDTRINYYLNPFASLNYISSFGFYQNLNNTNVINRGISSNFGCKNFLYNEYSYFEYKNNEETKYFDLYRDDWNEGVIKITKTTKIISPWIIYLEWSSLNLGLLFLSFYIFKKNLLD
ncbi:hypothetical protein [Spiroplasma sp. BIUS-1]|uniref:hypothetical protein n=1 Tax=Spiroplasma sp. BIUS-1 TaxID=216964 RepID=UPI0013A6D4AE|nr:hypothetical protein [Spiroplasma sp. BIUS-1]